MTEKWKSIPGYNGFYEASSMGRIKSLKFNKERILKSGKNADGYLQVALSSNGKYKSFKVSVLIAITFLGHTPNKQTIVVDHKDFDVTNDKLDNLQLITHRKNLSKDTFRKNPHSQNIGVSWHKTNKKWISYIRIEGKLKHLGYFKNENEAAEKYELELSKLINK